jgi:hypothetical protein
LSAIVLEPMQKVASKERRTRFKSQTDST